MCFQKHEQHLKKQEIEGPFQLIFFKVCSACFALCMSRDGSLILYPGVILVDNEKGRITESFPTGVEVI